MRPPHLPGQTHGRCAVCTPEGRRSEAKTAVSSSEVLAVTRGLLFRGAGHAPGEQPRVSLAPAWPLCVL